MKKTLAHALLIAGIVLLAGCTKDGNRFRSGNSIHFTAGSGSTATKTAYSGEGTVNEAGRLTWERIDWKDGDIIRIWSDNAVHRNIADQHYADYRIENPTGSGTDRQSRASLSNVDKNGLVWRDQDGNYTFWSVYPYDAAIDKTDWTTGDITLEIPSAQEKSGTATEGMTVTLAPDMNKAVMLATNTISTAATSDQVYLEFYPSFTAFEFTLHCAEDATINLTKFTLSSTSAAVAGPFVAQVSDGKYTYTCPARSEENGALTFDLTGSSITDKQYLVFTVFALPQDLKDLTITFTDDNKVTRSLDLCYADGTTLTFGACKKHRIYGLAMPDSNWKFALLLENGVLDWIGENSTTSFSEQIQAFGFYLSDDDLDEKVNDNLLNTDLPSLSGSYEETDAYTAINPKHNHYLSNDITLDAEYNAAYAQGTDSEAYKDFVAAHPDYNYRYYQIRTLYQADYFTIAFEPVGPEGGKWNLEKSGANPNNFTVKRVEYRGGEVIEYDESSSLEGDIMGNVVVLRIYPNVSGTHGDLSMYFKTFFTTSDESTILSADSELQDVHQDGSISYYCFTIPGND